MQAFTVPPAPDIIPFDTFFHVAGGATVSGFAENWDSDAWTTRYSQLPLWDVEDFDFVIDDLDGAPEALVLMILRESRTFTIDLSSVEVGQAFTLQSFAMATAYNRIAGPPSEFGSSATAFLRDPQGTGGTGHRLQRAGADRRAQPGPAGRDAGRARALPAGLDRRSGHPAVQRRPLHASASRTRRRRSG